MSLGQKISTDIILTTVINISKKVRGIVFIPLITKLLGTAAYGTYIQVIVVSTLFAGVFRLGLPSTLVHYMQKTTDEQKQSQLYYSLTIFAVGSGLGIFAIFFSVSPLISRFTLGTQMHTEIFRIGALLIPVYIVRAMAQNYFRANRQIKRFSILDGIKTYLVVGTVLLVLLLSEAGLKGVITTVVVVETVFATSLQGVIYSQIGFHRPVFRDFDKYLRYSIPLMITNLSGTLQSRADRLLLGYSLGPSAVGIYSIAYTLAQLIRVFVLPLRVTLFPELSHLVEKERYEECRNIVESATRYFVTIAVPSVVGLYLVRWELLNILSTTAVVENSNGVVLVLAVGIFFWGLEILHRQMFHASGQTTRMSQVRIAGSVLNLVLNVVLIGPMGILGAAVATLVSYIATFSLTYRLARLEFKTQLNYSLVLKVLVAAFSMASVVLLFHIDGILVTVLVAPFVYFSTLLLIGGFGTEELREITELVKSDSE